LGLSLRFLAGLSGCGSKAQRFPLHFPTPESNLPTPVDAPLIWFVVPARELAWRDLPFGLASGGSGLSRGVSLLGAFHMSECFDFCPLGE
jgi:hypothetical protein